MTPQQIPKDEPLRDVFATQGILVVTAALIVVVLHIFAPEYCNALLTDWHRIYTESPAIETLAAQFREWFALIFAG